MNRAFLATATALAAAALPLRAAPQTLTLAAAADSALATHPAARAAGARLEGARATADAARGALLPGLAANASLTRFQEPMVVAPLHGFDPTDPPGFDRTLVQGRLGVLYTVFDGGERTARVRAADALTEAAEAGLEGTEDEVLEAVAERYLGVLSARALLQAAERQLAALEEEHARAERRFEAGSAAEIEVVRVRASRQDARAQTTTAEAQVALAERTLARIMGMPPGSLETVVLSEPSPAPTASDSAGAGENPGVLRAEHAVRAAEARMDEAQAGRLPRLAAGAGLLDFGTATGRHVLEWQAGVELSWPLFTGGSRAAAVQRARAELAAARSELDLVELEVGVAVDAAQAAVVEANARAEALALAVAEWEEVARIEALSLEEGAGEQRDFLRAQAGLFRARAGHARARHDAVLAHVRLARARGILDRAWLDRALEMTP